MLRDRENRSSPVGFADSNRCFPSVQRGSRRVGVIHPGQAISYHGNVRGVALAAIAPVSRCPASRQGHSKTVHEHHL
jgi:hypothetical protein